MTTGCARLTEWIIGYDGLRDEDVEMGPGTPIILDEYVGAGTWKARLLDEESGLPRCFFHVHVDSISS